MAGQSLSNILSAYYTGTTTGKKGSDRRWQNFCAANELTYQITGNTIAWHDSVRTKVQERVNRFNDLYDAGSLGSAWGVVAGPSERKWAYTPAVVDKFLNWVKAYLEKELSG